MSELILDFSSRGEWSLLPPACDGKGSDGDLSPSSTAHVQQACDLRAVVLPVS